MRRIIMPIMVLISLAACREEIVHLSSELEANRVMLGLRLEGIDARKTFLAKEWIIDVPKSDLTDALRVLDNKRIFRDQPSEIEQTGGSDMFASRQDKDSKANKIIEVSLSSTLRILPKVLDARVHIFQHTPDLFSLDSGKERSASVLIVTRDKMSIDVAQVKELVSQGAGLKEKSVSVVLVENSPTNETSLVKTNYKSKIDDSENSEDVNELEESSKKNILDKFESYQIMWLALIVIVLIVLSGMGVYVFMRKKTRINSHEDLDPDMALSLMRD